VGVRWRQIGGRAHGVRLAPFTMIRRPDRALPLPRHPSERLIPVAHACTTTRTHSSSVHAVDAIPAARRGGAGVPIALWSRLPFTLISPVVQPSEIRQIDLTPMTGHKARHATAVCQR
jgi:hypothetical protein